MGNGDCKPGFWEISNGILESLIITTIYMVCSISFGRNTNNPIIDKESSSYILDILFSNSIRVFSFFFTNSQFPTPTQFPIPNSNPIPIPKSNSQFPIPRSESQIPKNPTSKFQLSRLIKSPTCSNESRSCIQTPNIYLSIVKTPYLT